MAPLEVLMNSLTSNRSIIRITVAARESVAKTVASSEATTVASSEAKTVASSVAKTVASSVAKTVASSEVKTVASSVAKTVTSSEAKTVRRSKVMAVTSSEAGPQQVVGEAAVDHVRAAECAGAGAVLCAVVHVGVVNRGYALPPLPAADAHPRDAGSGGRRHHAGQNQELQRGRSIVLG